MSKDNPVQSSIAERNEDPELRPDVTPNPVEELNPANDKRSLEYGESGQFAPGGYYNQQGVNESNRVNLDDQVDSALNKEKA